MEASGTGSVNRGIDGEGQDMAVGDDRRLQQDRGIGRLLGSYFFHISCAQSGSQAGGDMRKASSAVDL
jgi:hypothetical protein